jgi:hypothetical protein
VSNIWWAKIQKIDSTVAIVVHVRSRPVAMLVESPAVEPSPLCPDPGRATWKEEEDAARTPLSVPLLSARCRPSWPRQRRPTVPRRHDQAPPARPQGRRARLCSRTPPDIAPSMPLETLAPAPSRAYKPPRRRPEAAHPHRHRFPLFFLPLSLGIVRALHESAAAFWRSPATVGHAAGARRRSRAAAAVLRHRRRPLLLLRRAPAVEHSSLQAPVSFRPSRGRRRR